MKRSLKLKVCGMRETQNILDLAKLNPDFIGFIFYEKSKRNAQNQLDPSIVKNLPEGIKKIGVFVDEPTEFLLQRIEDFSLDGVQLHGSESPKHCEALKKKGLIVIKVFAVGDSFDFDQLKGYEAVVDYFLFDTKGSQKGGNGVSFDWSILQQYPLKKPFILSGGISLENVAQVPALKNLPLIGIDINSRFEVKPGLKNIQAIKKLKQELTR